MDGNKYGKKALTEGRLYPAEYSAPVTASDRYRGDDVEEDTMSAFDRIIGYETIKQELLQLCDIIGNREIYEQMGAKLPQGILLYGDPGLGKTLMAKCLIEESGLEAFLIRRNKGDNDFIAGITDAFAKAKENAPSIVFLDDLDKFANEDDDHRDAEEYVAVQACIDDVKNSGVFVLATANDIRKMPRSLTRSGRFDRKIFIRQPTDTDAVSIITHYLKGKRVSDDVHMEDLARMISYSSCADLEMILNEAAISAAFARKKTIDMSDLVKAVLRMQYNAPDNFTKVTGEDMKRLALHEAGHLVASEVLCPGSVGFASLRTTGRDSTGGFVHLCKEMTNTQDLVLIALAGKAAVELYYSEKYADGCKDDIRKAFCCIRSIISEEGARGFGMIHMSDTPFPITSENLNARKEAVVHAELERSYFITKDILLKNKAFLEKASSALIEKETLLYSDIKAIRENVTVIGVSA
ncbi:MAG: AAA family ATPase [Eubacteriales bacterium]|jgi:cell division protease FtsH